MATKTSRSLPYVLSTAYLLYEIGTNIYKWHHNEISGKRCAKNVIDAAGALAGGIGGGALGAAMGAFGGPIGIVIGGLAGGFLGAISGDALTNLLTEKLFDLPKTVALEEAYKFLGINHRATDEEVRSAYKKKLLTCHPDKGGSQELFLRLQSCLGVIVVARGWKPS
uniref:J domain-containing protein n=1 Tax=Panagrolaimus davidi TaxID=227884 RepID=A0A914PNM5_9BILA